MLLGFGGEERREIRLGRFMLRRLLGIDDPAERGGLEELLELRQILGILSGKRIEFSGPRSRLNDWYGASMARSAVSGPYITRMNTRGSHNPRTRLRASRFSTEGVPMTVCLSRLTSMLRSDKERCISRKRCPVGERKKASAASRSSRTTPSLMARTAFSTMAVSASENCASASARRFRPINALTGRQRGFVLFQVGSFGEAFAVR